MTATAGLATITYTNPSGIVEVIAVNPSVDATIPFFETRPLELGLRETQRGVQHNHAYVDGVLLEMEAPANALDNLVIYVGTQDRLRGPTTWHGPFSAADSDEVIFERVAEARYFTLRMYDFGARLIWQLSGMEFYGRRVGGRS